MHFIARRMTAVTTLSAMCLIALTACTSSLAEPIEAAEAQDLTGDFPRTIEVPESAGGQTKSLVITNEPRAIAALDYESAEVIAALGYADRLVLVPEAVLNPALGGHVEEMQQVSTTFPVAMDLDSEVVISTAPDLVVMSPRHGAEDQIGAVLAQAGLTTLQLPTSWTTIDHLKQNIALIGESIGADTEADNLETLLANGLATSEHTDDLPADAPRVLMLTNQAGRPFITAGRAFPLQLLELSGAKSVSDELDIDVTGPISVEQVVRANPDGIVLIDMNGTGDRLFTDLLENPAIATLPVVSEGRVLRVTGREVQALGLHSTIDGLSRLTDWVATLD